MENGKTLETREEMLFDDSLQEPFGDSLLFSFGGNRGIFGDDDRFISDKNVVVGSEIAGHWDAMEVAEGGNTVVCVDKMTGGDDNCSNLGGNSAEKGDVVKVVEGENVGVCVERTSGGKENCSNICKSETHFSVDSYMDRDTEMHVNGAGSSYVDKNQEAKIDGADMFQQTVMSLFGNKSEEFGIEKTVETEGKEEEKFMQSNEAVHKMDECEENRSNIGETEKVFWVDSYTGRDAEIQVYDTGFPMDERKLLMEENSREISINGDELFQDIAMGLFGSKFEEFNLEKTVGSEGKEDDKLMRSNETDSTAKVKEDSMNTCEKSEEFGIEKTMENKGNKNDIFMCSNETDSTANAKAKEESLKIFATEKENMGNLSEGDMDAVEEETPSVKLEFDSSKRKRGCNNQVANGKDDAKSLDLAFSDKGYQGRDRKRSKYLSPPYYSDGFLDFLPEDSRISKVSYERMSDEKPSKKPVDPSNHSEVIDISPPELLSELQMIALDSHYPNENKYFHSMNVFFSKFRESVYHDESNIGICSKNTIDQYDVLDSSISDHYPDSSDSSSAEVMPEPKRRNTEGKSTGTSSISIIDLIDVDDSSVANLKTDTSFCPSPKVEAEPKERNTQMKPAEGKSEPKKRTNLPTLGNSATASADVAELNNVKPISLVVNLPIDPQPCNVEKESPDPQPCNVEKESPDPQPCNVEKESPDPTRKNTDLATGMPDFNGISELPEKQKAPAEVGKPEPKESPRKEKLPSESKPERKKRARKEKPPSEGKRERKKRVKKEASMADLEKGTEDSSKASDVLPLFIIKQNLEIMTSMIVKSGDEVSADMKAKLIDKIERLLEKVHSRDESSSS